MPGVWRAVSYSKGAVVIFHSPKSCAHVTHSMDIGSCFRAKARREMIGKENVALVSSLLTEKHSIFGGEAQLANCIDYVVNTYEPQYIVIAGSCVAGVIGDDVQSVAAVAENKYHLPILAIPCSGFLDGEYYIGYLETALALIERFMVKAPAVIERTAVLLGDQGGAAGDYVREVKKLLNCFGIEVIGQFPTYTNYDEMNKIPSAALTVVLGGSGQSDQYLIKMAQRLRERFGMPYLGGVYPIGWNNTRQWLHDLGILLQQEKLAQTVIEQEAAQLFPEIETAREKLQGKKAVLCVGRLIGYFRPQWLIELLTRLEVTLIGVIVLDGYTAKDRAAIIKSIRNCTDAAIYQAAEGESLLQEADFVLTTHEINAAELRQLFLPVMPTAGITGEIKFIEKMVRLLSRHPKRGGVVYG